MKITPKFLIGAVEKDVEKIPFRVKIVVLALFVYTLAWGVLEPLEAIYFDSFVDSYFEIGIIFSIFNFALLLLAIPVGALADRVSATKLVPLGMLLYPAIGAFYFSITNTIQLSVTRLLNGLGATFVWVSGETYIRKQSQKGKTAETFGFYSSMVNLAYVLGSFAASILVLKYAPRELFLLLIPIPSIAAMIIWMLHSKNKETIIQGIEEVIEKDGAGTRELFDFFASGKAAFYCLLLAFFGGIFAQILMVFVPLGGKQINMSLSEIAMLYAIIHIPLFAGFFFSEIADRKGKTKTIILGLLLASAALLLIPAMQSSQIAFAALCFLFGLSIAIIGPALNGLITDITPKNESGEITGIINAAYYLGCTIGPLALGAIADIFGYFNSFAAAGIITLLLAVLTFALKGFLTSKEQKKIPDKKRTEKNGMEQSNSGI